MNKERAKHGLQMAEIVAKVNNIPKHVIGYFEKEKINLKKTVIIDQEKIAACKNRINSMCSESELPKNKTVARCSEKDKFVDVLPGLCLHQLKGYLVMGLPI